MKKFFTTMIALVAIAGGTFSASAQDDSYFKCYVDGKEVKDGDRIDLSDKPYFEEEHFFLGDVDYGVYKRQFNTLLTVMPTVDADMSVTVDYVMNNTPLDNDKLYGADLAVNFCGFTGSCTSIQTPGQTYTREGATVDGKELDMQTELVVGDFGSEAGGDFSKLAINAEFTMTFKIEDQTVKLTFFVDRKGLAGIEDIESDSNIPAVYFDLQGRRVENPANGLYIVKKGNTVSKQFVR